MKPVATPHVEPISKIEIELVQYLVSQGVNFSLRTASLKLNVVHTEEVEDVEVLPAELEGPTAEDLKELEEEGLEEPANPPAQIRSVGR